MNRFLSEIQEKYTELVQIVKISISFNRLVFPVKYMKLNRFSHPMTHFSPKIKAFPLSFNGNVKKETSKDRVGQSNRNEMIPGWE